MSTPTRISIKYDDKIYEGTYTVSQGMIIVSTEKRTKTTHLGDMPVEALARMLLIELVRERKA